MKKSRFTNEQITFALKQAETGTPVTKICKKKGVSESNQTVKGVIIALEDDLKIRRALTVASHIKFYRYEVSFSLTKA